MGSEPLPYELSVEVLSGNLTISPEVWEWICASQGVSGAFHAAFLRVLGDQQALQWQRERQAAYAAADAHRARLEQHHTCDAAQLLVLCVLVG